MLTLASPVKFNRNYFRSLHSKRRRLAVRLLRLLPVLRKGRWLSTGNRFFANRTPQINSKLDSFGSNLRLPAEWAILSARRDCVALVVDAARFRIQLISDSCRHIFGGEPADFTSQCLENIVHPSDWPALCEGLMRLTSIRPTSNSPSLSSMTVGLDTLELSSIVRDINLLLPLHAQLQPLHVSIKVSTGFYEYCLVDLYGHLFAPSETSANLFSQENTHHLNSFVLVATDRVEALCSGHPPESAARTNLKATLNLLCLDERQLVLCRLLLSLDGIILFASPALTYVLGWRPFDLTNKSIYNLLKPPYDAAMAAIMMNATTNMSHTSSLETLTLVTSRGGPDVPVKIHLQPVVRPFGLSSSLCFGVTVQAIGALPPSYSSTDATFSSAIPLLHFPVSSSSTSSLSSTVPLADLPSLQPVAENTWLDPSVDHNHNLLRHHRPPAQSSSSSSSSSSSLFQHAIIYQEQPTPSTFSPHLPPTNNEFDPPLSQVAKINVNILANTTKPHQHVASTEDTRPNPPVTVSSSSSPLLPLSIGVASLTVDATTTTTTNNNNNNNNNDDNNDDGNDDDKDSNTSSASTPPPPSPRPSATTTKTSPSGSGKNNGRRRKRGKARRKPVVSPTNSSAPTKKNTEPRVPKRNMTTKKEEQRRAREKLQEENEKQNLTSPESSPAQDFYHTPHKRAYKKQPRAPTERRCESCNTGVTPEWRRGPNGPKTLCNACGLQFAKRVKQSSETSSVSSGSSSTTIGQHMELKTDPNPNEQTRPDAIDSNVSDAEHSVPRLQLSLPDFSNWSNPLATNSNSQTSIVPSTTLSFLGARGWVPPIRHDNVHDDDDEDEDEVEGYNHDDEDDSADNLQ